MKDKILTIGIDASRAFVAEPAGPEYYSWHLIKNLSEIDHKNRYVLYLRTGQLPDFPLPRNFTRKYIHFPRLWTQLGLTQETILHKPDVLFIPAHTLPLLTRLLLPRLPILVTIHGLEGKFLPQSGNLFSHFYQNWSISWAVRFATHLIAVSDHTRRDVLHSFNIDPDKIETIYEGVDQNRFANVNKDKIKEVLIKYRIQKKYLLFVGTIQPRKNLKRLIKAFSGIKSKDFCLVIAGKKGWLYESILNAPKRYKIAKRVVFTGRVSDDELTALYIAAEAFILPSVTEGFGLPVLEAQAAGTPVIVANSGALPAVAGKGAILVNPLSTDDIQEKISKILDNSGFREEIIKKGTKNVRQYSWRKTADKTLVTILKLATKTI